MKIILNSLKSINKCMAGPAIRYWEFAKVLSAHHDVTLLTPNDSELVSSAFKVEVKKRNQLSEQLKHGDILVTQMLTPLVAWHAKKHGLKVILDAYDPMPLENLELFKDLQLSLREHKNSQVVKAFLISFGLSDAILCANQAQFNLWTGMLLAQQAINPSSYDEDPSLNNRIGIVPFGLPSKPPKYTGNGMRKLFNLGEKDYVLLWGGGIWNWFDPLTLIKAIKQLEQENFKVHLVFMGIQNPTEKGNHLKMSREAIALAKELGIFGTLIHVNEGWTPYEQRQNFLLEADIGVSSHFDHLETKYSFRTRMLDYIWAGLPIIATEGDCFAELIASKELGLVVPYKDVAALSRAIRELLTNSEMRHRVKQNLADIRPNYYWNEVTKPLLHLIGHLGTLPKQPARFLDKCKIVSSFARLLGPAEIRNEIKYRFHL